MDDFVRQTRTNRGAGATKPLRPVKPWDPIDARATAPSATIPRQTMGKEWQTPKPVHTSRNHDAKVPSAHNRHVISLRIPRHPIRVLHHYADKKSKWLTDTKVMQWLLQFMPHRRKHPWLSRLGWGFMALIILSTLFINVFEVRQQTTGYALSAAAEELLPTANAQFAEKVNYDSKTASYQYNQGYTASAAGALSSGGPRFTAKVAADVSTGGVSVTDPESNVSMTLIPQFTTRRGEQTGNRLVYPLVGRDAQKVYTLGATGIKEDIILNKNQGNTAAFSYKLQLPSGTEARLLTNGGLGVYGVSSTLLGNVTTGSEKDAALLEKARNNGAKTNLLFTLPAPYVKEAGGIGASQKVQTYYEYKNNILTVQVNGLAAAAYPLTIDPTIYIDTASNFMQGNNESNIEFDGTNDTIKKGKTTGARINAWNQSLAEPVQGIWDQGTVAANGYVYSIGGSTQGNAGKQTFYVAGTQTFTVPTGVTSLSVKLWGAGGGGGAGGGAATGATGAGGNGGGGGYAQGNIAVAGGDTLSVDVGTGGAAGGTLDNAGNGGGYSAIRNSGGTKLIIAGGGAGGGGSAAAVAGGAGSAGGSVTTGGTGGGTGGAGGTAASGSTQGNGGAGATGGSAGAAGNNAAAGGAGGDGGGGNTACGTATTTKGGAGGTGAGGAGGDLASCSSGGGGGGGYAGGGGGGSGNTSRGGGGGGGGSSFATGTGVTGGSTTTGANQTPGQNGDADRGTAGQGGTGNAVSGANTAGTPGGVVISYTLSGGSTYTTKVYWAQFNSSTDVVQSPTPSSVVGTCSSWCNNAAYDLPAGVLDTNGGLRGMSVVGYNGFIYVLGGLDGGGARSNKIYIAKLGANGEPQLWHPTGGTATYWYKSSITLPDTMSYSAAVAYNNGLYIFGGQTGTNTAGDSLVRRADILPTGDIGSWSSTGMTALPSARSGHSIQVYNDVVYLVDGRNSSGTFLSDAYYARLNSDGTMGAWTPTNIPTGVGRATWGGSFSAIWGGYLYLGGGCTAVTSGFCSTIASDVQLASINADGSLANWGTIGNITHQRIGATMLTWQGALYRVGGCGAQNTSTGVCDNLLNNVEFGTINPDGDASTVSNSNAANTLTCSGSTPYNCDLPAAGTGAQQGGQMSSMVVISNGYIYNIGGCVLLTTGSCTAATNASSMSGNVSYAVLNSDGTMGKPATCPNGAYVTNSLWCVDNVNVIAGSENQYSTGTLTQSGNAVVGTATWGAAYVGGVLRYLDGTTALITGRTDNTHITVNVSKTISTGQTYSIWTQGIGAAAATVFNSNIYIIGGTDGSGNWTGNIQYVPLASDGSLSTRWNILNPTLAPTTGLPTATFPSMTTYNGIGYSYAFTRANPATAGSVPGSLYILGGCAGNASIGCSDYTDGVYKCNIATSGAVSSCSTTGQLQIDPDGAGTRYNGSGLGLMAGTVYANRIYLIGGACAVANGTGNQATDPCGSSYNANRQDTIYAKINTSGNIVDNVSGGAVTGTDFWDLTTGKMSPVRRRAVSFGYNGFIYSLAGFSGSSSLQDLLFSKINVSTGDLPNNFSSSGVVVTPRWDLRAIVSNGYVYAMGGCAYGAAPANCGSMQPQIQTFQLYNNDSGAAASYANATNPLTTAAQRVGTSSVILNGYIYNAGGCTDIGCTAFSNKVYYAPIDSYGVVGTWHEATFSSLGTNLPASLAWGKLVAAGGTLYYVGGQTGTATTTAVSTIYYASSFNTGAPVTWSTASGGIGDTAGQVAQVRTQAGVAVWNNRIYVVGGYGGASTTSTVYYSPDLSAGGNIAADSWMSSTAISVARAGLALVAYGNNLYVLGGYDGTNYLNDTQFASIGYKTGTMSQTGTAVTGAGGASWSTPQIAVGMTLLYPADGTTATITAVTPTTSLTVNVSRTVAAGTSYQIFDGSVGSWTPSTPLPGPIRDADGFAANGYLYLIGGRSNATPTCTPNSIISPISANTTITSGNNPTGLGDWYETNQRYTTDRYGSGLAYGNGRAYIMGGGCSALVASAVVGDTWLQTSTLKSQPQIAKYSKMIDTDKDVFASMWLTNGVDNSTGARWSFKYRSMNDPNQTNPTYQCGGASMPTWGQETNFGPIQLSKPGVYTPKNGAGTNINCSRFYYLSFSIDSSQAFGYPEDNNRGPYISDISLYYTASASGRLIHGKTFSGGLQQPLDTPCRTSNNSSDPNYAACPLP